MSLAAILLAFVQIPQAQPPSPTNGALVHQQRVFELPDGAVAYIPVSAGAHPPLLVLLHGAGHQQLKILESFEDEADKRGIVLLAPDSRGPTWDVVRTAEESPSVESPLAQELAHRFSASADGRRVEAAIANLGKIIPIDRAHSVLAGFSDGATFALGMGMSRDHPFSSVIAWSPGIAIESSHPARGRRVFISHGRQDPVLRFDITCGEIVPMLEEEGARVTFLPFNGRHEIPAAVKDALLDAAFGTVPGTVEQPPPAEVERCAEAQPEIPDLPRGPRGPGAE
jgi:phospholipase/carboxylesterase